MYQIRLLHISRCLPVRVVAGTTLSEHHYPRLQPSLEIKNFPHFPQSASSLYHSLGSFIKISCVKCKEWGVRSDATRGCCCKPANRFKISPAQPPLRSCASESRRCGKCQRESVVKVNKAGRCAFILNAAIALLSVSRAGDYAVACQSYPGEEEGVCFKQSLLPTGQKCLLSSFSKLMLWFLQCHTFFFS